MARLANGTRKKGGTFEKRLTIDGVRYSVYGKTTQDIAEKEKALRERISAGLTGKANITLDKYFDLWITEKAKSVTGQTILAYKQAYDNHIRGEKLGKCKLEKITKATITELLDGCSTTDKMKNYIIKVLKCVFNTAVNDDMIIKSPMQTIKAYKVEKTKAGETNHRALTIDEQKAFMQELRDSNSYYYNYIALMLNTGMRAGEVGALTWADIDTKRGFISVNKTITRDADGKRIIGTTPKTDASNREIPITPQTLQILQDARKAQKMLDINGNGVLFMGLYGRIIGVDTLDKHINKTIASLNKKGYNIAPFSSHAFRDTFATRFIEQTKDYQTLKKILGHSSITMTMDLYAHVLQETKTKVMNSIEIAM